MRIELEKRPQVSKLYAFVSPLLALILTLIFGAIMFAMLGKDPVEALDAFFLEPLLEVWSLHELAVKAAPLILIAVGLAVCYRSNNWNIGAEGQFTIGAITGSYIPIVFYDWHSPLVLPLMLILGALGGALFAAIPALLKAHFNTNEILTSLMLVYIAQLFLDWLIRGAWRDPKGFNFPVSRDFAPEAIVPAIWEEPAISPGYGFTAIIVAFLGRLNPLGIIASGLVLALTYLGGEAAQLSIGVSDKVTRVFQGLILFFVLSCDTLIYYKIRIVWSRVRGGVA
jgi:ABC-type uncharacterized transport system permease subunit